MAEFNDAPEQDLPRDELPEDELQEIVSRKPVLVPETSRLFRLTPQANDLARTSRQSAIVAADNERQARDMAKAVDPFGRDWGDETTYVCDVFEDTQRHVVGDVIFRSIAAPGPETLPQRKSRKKPR
jgi:hypothetical protein